MCKISTPVMRARIVRWTGEIHNEVADCRWWHIKSGRFSKPKREPGFLILRGQALSGAGSFPGIGRNR
jgi:hypothetical protein